MSGTGRVVLLCVAAGCAAPISTEIQLSDGAVGLAQRDAGVTFATIEAPEAPAVVSLDPVAECPDGWHVEVAGPTSYCAPFDGLPPDCGDLEMLLPGRGCVAVGTACPSGDFPVAPQLGEADGNARFVRLGADEIEADGSRDRPFASIQAALDDAPDDGYVHVAAGEYVGRVTVRRGVTLRGVCASGTVLSVHEAAATLTPLLSVVRGRVDNLQITQSMDLAPESNWIGLSVVEDAALSNVAIRHTEYGLTPIGGMVRAENLLIQGTQAGVVAVSDGSLVGVDISIRDFEVVGATIGAEGHLALSQSAITRAGEATPYSGAFALGVIESATAEMRDVYVRGETMYTSESASLVGQNVVSEQANLYAVRTQHQSVAVLDRLTVLDAFIHGAFVQDESDLTARDTVILSRDFWNDERAAPYWARTVPEGWGAEGVVAFGSAHARVERLYAEGLAASALGATLSPAETEGEDIWLMHLRGLPPAGTLALRQGFAIEALAGGRVTVARVHIEDGVGGAQADDGSELIASDLSFKSMTWGVGTWSTESTIRVDRAAMEAMLEGVSILQDSVASPGAVQASIHDVRMDGVVRGAICYQGAACEFERVEVTNHVQYGLMVMFKSSATISNVKVRSRDVWADDQSDFGFGLWVHDAQIIANKLDAQGRWAAAIFSQVNASSELDLRDVILRDTPVGIWCFNRQAPRVTSQLSSTRTLGVPLFVSGTDTLPTPPLPTQLGF